MKKTVVILVSVLVVGLGVGLVIWHERNAERAAIQQVLNERLKAHETFIEHLKAARGLFANQLRVKAITDYITELGKIDPSTCPKQFRDAWVSYVESWERKKDPIIQEQNQLDKTPTKQENHIGLSEGLTTGGQIGSDIERPNLHDAAERLEKTDSDEAWLNCKRVAMDFGVFVPADPN